MAGTKLLSSGNGAPGAAAGSSTPPGVTTLAAAPGGAAGSAPAATPFDAILMLEEIAAAATGDVGIDAGTAELGTDGTDTTVDDPSDDEDNLELDNPLAFLAGLIAAAPHTHPHVAGAGAGEGGTADGADALAGSPGGDADASGIPLFGDGTGATNAKPDDAAAAARALAAQAALTAVDSRGKEDKGTATRALELFSHAPRVADQVEHAPVTTHVRDPRWAEEFGTRIALLVNQRESVAAISLTPADLGPVEVNVTVRDSQATILFGAAQAETRALIEASLPKLRELLAAQGFQLMDASVSQGFQQSRREAPSVPRPSSVEEVTHESVAAARLNGLLDTYA
jgi:flagellar hook-length control protein FliK